MDLVTSEDSNPPRASPLFLKNMVDLRFLLCSWWRCTYIGSYDSATWPAATADEFEPVLRVCRIILSVSDGGYQLNPDWVIKRLTYTQTQGRAPPYLIYLDHDHGEIVLAIQGLQQPLPQLITISMCAH